MNQPELVAAVDLGSNSFRMEVGRTAGQQIYTVDALREPVRLAQGLTKDKKLDRDAFARGLATLDRFGERLRGFDKRRVRAVATNTLRVARNAPEFVREGEARLGFPIEVIAGREEARLIYSGVAHSLEAGGARRLVVDIGGGSTELIVGTGYEPEVLESVYVGCVGTSVRFFPDGNYTKASIKEAELSARRELEPFSKSIRKAGWTEAIGSSGTARALADLIHANFGIRGISADGLERLRAALIRAGRASELWLEGLKPDRVPVLAGGLAIMSAVFSEFKIDYMSVSDGALRTGVLYDLLGRTTHAADMRETTVARFMTRYRVDELHATSVARLATSLWESLVQASLDRESGHADEAQAAH